MSVSNNLLSLEQMLNEYIYLKEKSMLVDHERVTLMQERNQVHMLMQGMQNVIDTYNALPNHPLLPNVVVVNANSPMVLPQQRVCNKTPSGVPTIVAAMQNNSLPNPINTNREDGILSTPMISSAFNKRKDTQALSVPTPAKKPRGRPPGKKTFVQGQNTLPRSSNVINNQVVCSPTSTIQSSTKNCAPSTSQVQGVNAAKCLINQPSLLVPTNSPVRETPPRAHPSHTDRCVSFADTPLVARFNEEAMPSAYSVSLTKKVMVSPAQKMAYIEKSQCNSTVKADIDKTKLDFDDACDRSNRLDKLPNEVATIESDKEVDTSGYLPDIDFSEFENDIGISYEDINFSDHLSPTHSKDNALGYDCSFS